MDAPLIVLDTPPIPVAGREPEYGLVSKSNLATAHLAALAALDVLRRPDGDLREALEGSVDALLILIEEFGQVVTGLQAKSVAVEEDDS